MSSKKPLVLIVMGSDSDLPVMKETAGMLENFGIPFEITVSSAHRSPDRTIDIAKAAADNGVKVIVAGAGGAAHLPGVIAAVTTLPVIGVPMETRALAGADSLFSIVQMPRGIPVACMAIGAAGAVNAGVLAAQIISTGSAEFKKKLKEYKKSLDRAVKEKSDRLASVGYKKYQK